MSQNEAPKLQVSMCCVVRNESTMLPGLMAAMQPLVDQVVVIDTGSDDNTADVAKSAGADVFTCRTNNMSEARNEATSLAKHDWVLFLDADEVMTSVDYATLVEEVHRRPEVDAWILPIMNYIGRGEWSTFHTPRLLRRSKGILWSGTFHETLLPSLAQLQCIVEQSTAPIRHLEIAGGKSLVLKRRRNIDRLSEMLMQPEVRDRAALLVLLSLDYAALNLDREASRCLEEARIQDAHGYFVGRFWGLDQLARGNVQNARNELGSVLAACSHPYQMAAVHGDLVQVCFYTGDARGARDHNRQAYELRGGLDYHLNAGLLAFWAGNYQGAVEAFRMWLAVDQFAMDARVWQERPAGSTYVRQTSVLPGLPAAQSAGLLITSLNSHVS